MEYRNLEGGIVPDDDLGDFINPLKGGASSAAAAINVLKGRNLKDILALNRRLTLGSLSKHLKGLCKEKHLTKADVLRDSGLTKAYLYQVFKGQRTPSRDKLIAIGFGLHLELEEFQRLLKVGGCSELYPRVERDTVIIYSVLHEYSIWETDDALYENGYETILKD